MKTFQFGKGEVRMTVVVDGTARLALEVSEPCPIQSWKDCDGMVGLDATILEFPSSAVLRRYAGELLAIADQWDGR